MLEDGFDTEEDFVNSGKIQEFYENLPKKNLIKYLKHLNRHIDSKEVKDFKSLLKNDGKFIYDIILDELVFEISERLSDALSDSYVDAGSDNEN